MLPDNRDNVEFSMDVKDPNTGLDVLAAVERVPDGDLRVVIVDYKNSQYTQFLPFQGSMHEAIGLLTRMMDGVMESYRELLK